MEIPKPSDLKIFERLDMKQRIAEQLVRLSVVPCDTDGVPTQAASIQYYRTGEEV